MISILILAGCFNDGERANAPVLGLGGYTILAYVDEGNKVVTLYGGAGIVCVENTRGAGNKPSTSQTAAFSCWDVETAPKKIRALIPKEKEIVPGNPFP